MPFSSASPCSGLSATLSKSVNNVAFILCSANSGHAIIGTPWMMLSIAELQPQWLKKAPVEP
ncbi:hypothetical protein Ahy_B02g057949 [Arachis hypogaea]|uniref:Uncharacterized protein n=1 Tax=Arachis hypogaea TaxID=3818 RepID=A0A445ADD1_ARAHY|nr:hypothetical protein Ahy_B02g057949 [Arachis hypogaea]